MKIAYSWTSIKYPPIKWPVIKVQFRLILRLILTFFCFKVNIHKQNNKGFLIVFSLMARINFKNFIVSFLSFCDTFYVW